MALLSGKAIVGLEETYRMISEGNTLVEVSKQPVVAELINAASQVIENYIQGPVVYRQFTEYYWGASAPTGSWDLDAPRGEQRGVEGDARLILQYRPMIVDGTHPLLVRVRESGTALDQSATGWTTWTENTDFVVNATRGMLTTNPTERLVWPPGFRNIYVSYYAGYGAQTLDSESEVITSSAPEDIKLACKKLIELWWKTSIIEMNPAYVDATNFRAPSSMSTMPMAVKELLRPYENKRPLLWMLH